MQIEVEHHQNNQEDSSRKCFDKFFLGKCKAANCELEHSDFCSEKELFEFCTTYRTKIQESLTKVKSVDMLLRKYILEHISDILDYKAEKNDDQDKTKSISPPKKIQNNEIELKEDFTSYYAKLYLDSKSFIAHLEDNACKPRKT